LTTSVICCAAEHRVEYQRVRTGLELGATWPSTEVPYCGLNRDAFPSTIRVRE